MNSGSHGPPGNALATGIATPGSNSIPAVAPLHPSVQPCAMPFDAIVRAAQFAEQCHHGSARKWTGEPYIEHPMRVAGRVLLLKGVEAIHVQAAWLHDVIEDCYITRENICRMFGEPVAAIVHALTNPSKKLELRRKEAKALYREHLATQPRWVKLIKLVDRIDNIRDSAAGPSDWKQRYGAESMLLAERLYIPGDDMLIKLVNELRSEIKRL